MAARLPPASPPSPQGSQSSRRRPNSQDPTHDLLRHLHTIAHRPLPKKATFISAFKACSLLLPAIPLGEAIHARTLKSGLGADRFLATSLVGFYSSHGRLLSARQVFDGIRTKDEVLHTAMLVGYAENGDVAGARDLFGEMAKRDAAAWNAMLTGYVRCGLPEDALELFRAMQISAVRPDEVTLIAALSACSQMGCLALGEWVRAYIARHRGVIRGSTTLGNSLVHMYAKCGRLDAALRLFLEQDPKNLETWNTMLTGLAAHGCGSGALSLLSQMMKIGLRPDRITFLGVLMACGHAGMVDHARTCFDCMARVYGVEPEAGHHGCMVDVLSRGGRLQEARALIGSVALEQDASAWGALLGGCFAYGDLDLGLEAARRLVELEPLEEGRYIALSNLYAMVGGIEDATRVRKVVDDMGIKRSSGRSAIEVDGVVHEFLAGDVSHLPIS